jgi:opacity protein-like surface antigen
MNKPITLRGKLNLLVKDDENPPSFEQLNDELREKGATAFRPLALSGSLSLDIALFFHKYFAATICAALLVAGVGAWIVFSTLGQQSPSVFLSSQETGASLSGQKLAATVPMPHVSTKRTQSIAANLSLLNTTEIDEGIAAKSGVSAATSPLLNEERQIAYVEPREPASAVLSAPSIPSRVGQENLRLSEPRLDYSGLTASISVEQSSIPANPNFAATNENDLNYQAGYRFDRYQEAGIGYSRHIYRQITSSTETFLVFNPATGKTTSVDQTAWHSSDNEISLPGIYYTYHANNPEFFGIEPFATAFASKPSAGFLWRASAGLEWNAWDNLNADISYSREQINSATYAAPQNMHGFFDFGLSYRLLP